MNIVTTEPYSLGAGWIHHMLGSPLEKHWINVTEGAVESLSPTPAHPLTFDLGTPFVILPAAINLHSHLELSQLTTPLDLPHRSMPHWVSALLAFRRSDAYQAERGIQQALSRPEFLESTAAVADIVPPTLPMTEIDTSPVTRLPFAELIAWNAERVKNINMNLPGLFGLSPHAPQTVCPDLLEQIVRHQVPLAMHLAETEEELQLLREGSGPLLEMMRHADPDYDPKSVLLGKRPMDYLHLLADAPSVFVIHGNYLDDEELTFLAQHRETMSVVYCPRSHAYFEHSPYPLKKMLDLGVNVLLGTDSLASVPDLSLVEEMRFILHHHPLVAADVVYRLGTTAGASALHLPKEYGTIQPGSPARFVALA